MLCFIVSTWHCQPYQVIEQKKLFPQIQSSVLLKKILTDTHGSDLRSVISSQSFTDIYILFNLCFKVLDDVIWNLWWDYWLIITPRYPSFSAVFSMRLYLYKNGVGIVCCVTLSKERPPIVLCEFFSSAVQHYSFLSCLTILDVLCTLKIILSLHCPIFLSLHTQRTKIYLLDKFKAECLFAPVVWMVD